MMNMIREFVENKIYRSDIKVDIYYDQLCNARCELMEYLHFGYDDNCRKLIDNYLYYEKLYMNALKTRNEYIQIAKRLGLK